MKGASILQANRDDPPRILEPEASSNAYVALTGRFRPVLRRMDAYTVQTRHGFRFVDEGPPNRPNPVVLLHGMLGTLGNWTATISALVRAGHRVVTPLLPVYDLPEPETSVSGLTRYTRRFIRELGIERPVLVGNSLGGHVALLYALQEPDQPSALILTGASGIHEIVTGESRPRRFDRNYVRERAAMTFYDPRHASEELVDEVMDIVADRNRVIRLIKMARSTREENVEDVLGRIDVPTLLIWGTDDRLTPLPIAHRFRKRMTNARLELISRCGHAPMIEHPARFNQLVIDFLKALFASKNEIADAAVRLSAES